MGITNLNPITTNSGLVMSNTYVSLTAGPPEFPNVADPLNFTWTYDALGKKSFFGNVTVFTYGSKALKDAGFRPIQRLRVTVPADAFAATAFSAVYANIQQAIYTNSTQDDGADFTTLSNA